MLIQASADPHAESKFWFGVIDSIVKSLALLIGAAWTYMHYKRSRVYELKLELGLSGRLFKKDGALYFATACSIKNIGESVYPLEQTGTACLVSAYRGGALELLRVFPVFEHHTLIEPGGQLDEPLVMQVPVNSSELIGLQVTLRVSSGNDAWESSCFIEAEDDPLPSGSQTNSKQGDVS